MLGTTGEVNTNAQVTFYYGLLLMDAPVLADGQKFTFTSAVQTLDNALRTYKERWPVGTDGERESGESVLSMHLDDDDDDDDECS